MLYRYWSLMRSSYMKFNPAFHLCGLLKISQLLLSFLFLYRVEFYEKWKYWLILIFIMCDQRGILFFTAFCTFFLLLLLYCMLMQSHAGNVGATQQIIWIYKFKFNLLIGSRATNSVVGVHWFPLRYGILLIMIC
jgi:hypothetical protein